VACVGDNCVDVSLEPPDAGTVSGDGGAQPGREFAGGNAFNVAVELSRLGCDAAYYGAVGNDPQAELIVSAAAAAGVDTSSVRRVPGATGRTVVARDEHGERYFVSEDYGVAAGYRLDEASYAEIARAQWAHFARQPDLAEWAPRLRAAGVRLSCDLGVEGGLGLLNALAPVLEVVFLSGSARDGRVAEHLLLDAVKAGARLAVVTLGAAGSTAANRERQWRIDAVPVDRVVDSLGAGDAYIAAFIAARLEQREIGDSLLAGATAGAAACTRWGLANPMPTNEVRV
jgi:fructoselysine 6-kinase